ncbi:unnamed protein product [Rotaria magnacalcarata]|uniref:RRM domain-containing protein n=1 Tax=Rotaria magnacalcarata TaxID=392030 RepID=A0A8S3AP48_9BILA|nr:unnamed protein product [Rotaria magnacalcarata]
MNLSGFNCGYALITYTCHDDAQREAEFEAEGDDDIMAIVRLLFFIIFNLERDDALHAMNLMNGREIDDSIVEVTSAKSVDKNQYFRFTRNLSLLIISANLSESLFCASIVFISIYV